MNFLAAIMSWIGMFAACGLLSHGLIHYAFPVAFGATLLRLLPPRARDGRFASYDPFLGLLPLWGVVMTVPREQWPESAILLTRMGTLSVMLLTAGWCLFRDWRRFRTSEETCVVS